MRSRLEALKAALTEIDTYGVLGAESVDEAQVTRLPGWVLFYANCLTLDARESCPELCRTVQVRKIERKWKQCHNPLYDPTADAYKQAEAEAAQKADQQRADKVLCYARCSHVESVFSASA